jgi:hypothetical protein
MPPELSVVPDEPKVCPWGTETTVIRHVRFTGKWVEIWIEGSESSLEPDPESGVYHYDYSSKGYMLTRAIQDAGLSDRVENRGHVGLGVVRGHPDDGSSRTFFEILRVFEATP